MPHKNPKLEEDPTLARLFEYTKFHIGIYISAAAALLAVASSTEAKSFFNGLYVPFLLAAIGLMSVAGVAGGVIASTCARVEKFSDVWDSRIGPWSIPMLRGRYWAAVEHTSFWLSAGCFAVAALWRYL